MSNTRRIDTNVWIGTTDCPILLPAWRREATGTSALERSGSYGRSPADKGRMKRILVVDDDVNLRELLATVLGQEGRVVDIARDGIEALELLNQNRYDLIISDLRMPGLNGPALYEALRATPQTTPTRVMFMTGNAATGEYATFLRGTTEPMLEKPFSLDVIRQMVRVLLNER